MNIFEHLTRRTLTLIALTVALSVGLAGFSPATASACDKHAKKSPTTQTAESDDEAKAAGLVHQGEAKVGDRTLCPVMGNEFEVTAESPSFEHDGKTIYFCCGGCGEGFAEDADNLLTAVNQKIDEANAAATDADG